MENSSKVNQIWRMLKSPRSIVFVLIIGLGAGLSSCYPGGPENAEQLEVVSTNYDSTFDFAHQKTYYMPDTIRYLTNESNQNVDTAVAMQFTHDLLKDVADNMASRGYVRVDTTSGTAPDMFVDVELIATRNIGVTTIPGPGYWGGYYPPSWGWGGFGSWYYPSYWGDYPVAYSYRTGTVIINISDPNAASTENNTIPLVWNAGMDDLLRDNLGDNLPRIKKGVKQAFDQSPYLKSEL